MSIHRIALPVAFAISVAVSSAWAEGDPNGDRNIAASSTLPAGQGLAAEFAADAEIVEHPEVIFAEDFEAEGYRQRWDDIHDKNSALSIIDASPDSPRVGTRSLRVTATLGRNTGGGMTKWFESSDRIFIRFYTRFDPNCAYLHHFCTLRANKALRGRDAWSGFGGAGERPKGHERFSTALEPWGNRGQWAPPGRWNFYSYWHEMSAGPDGRYWGNAFRPAEQPLIRRGEWICAELMLQHNTPAKADGEQAYWINGELRGHWKGIDWRKSADLRANAFTLESYVTNRWTKQSENIVDFDNIVIARQYIGPAQPAKSKLSSQ